MYVCICRGITDKQVREAVREGAQSVSGVYRCLGCTPNCGQCAQFMEGVIADEGSDASSPAEQKPDLPLDETACLPAT